MRDVNKKFSVRYFLNLVLTDEEDRRYFKQHVSEDKKCIATASQRRRKGMGFNTAFV